MINVKESYLWQQVKGGLESEDTHLSRIENTAGTGISDISACHKGVDIWIELKVFHGNRIHFRNSQRIWITRRLSVGGRVVVLARKEDVLHIFDAKETLLAPSRPESNGKSFSITWSDLPKPTYSSKKPFKWEEVRTMIFAQSDNYPVH